MAPPSKPYKKSPGKGRPYDLTGHRFGRWTAISRAGSTKYNTATWNCLCDCGTERVVDRQSLMYDGSKSCGCLLKENLIKRNVKRGEDRRKDRLKNRQDFLKRNLRKLWLRWPARYEARKEALVSRGIYECAGYKRSPHNVTTKEIHVDHIDPIGSFIDWNTWIEKLFCYNDNLQVLCKTCHAFKTKDERKKT